MKKKEYVEIEALMEKIVDDSARGVLEFVINLLKEINPGDEDVE